MFSGIIKCMGIVQAIKPSGSTLRITFSSAISDELRIDQSISHDGVCLTVVEVQPGMHTVDVVAETLSKTTFSNIQPNQYINLEHAITPTTLLDGHIVQGHIDTTIRCLSLEDKEGSWMYKFNLPRDMAALVIPHGSICINGVSLTVANLYSDAFDVTIIPYTYAHTNFKYLKEGALVNVEFDLIGKYLLRQSQLNN